MLFTVGHGTLEIDELTAVLSRTGISGVVDVRSFPGSRRFPHFNREAMTVTVPDAGLGYEWNPNFGGRRKPRTASAHVAWRNRSFQAYADYMMTQPFRIALDQLLVDASERDVAMMCAEAVWWRCHRRLIADAAVLLHGVEVRHLFHDGRLQAHSPTPHARIGEGGVLVYDLGCTPPLQTELGE